VSVPLEDYGFGQCEAPTASGQCNQAAIDRTKCCRWHRKVLLGLTAPLHSQTTWGTRR
jgi:hypothetical protein